MAIQSQTDLIKALCDEQRFVVDWVKYMPTATIGNNFSQDLTYLDGYPRKHWYGNLVRNGNMWGSLAEWNLGSGWSYNIVNAGANKVAGSANTLSQTSALTLQNDTQYVTSFYLNSCSGGTGFRLSVGGSQGSARYPTSSGSYREYLTTPSSTTQEVAIVPVATTSVVSYIRDVLVCHPLSFIPYSDTMEGCIPTGGSVAPYTKHLLSSLHTTQAHYGFLTLIDVLGVYPFISQTTANWQYLDNTAAITRHTNGAGVRAYVVGFDGSGAITQNFQMSYTNQNGVSGRTLPRTVTFDGSNITSRVPHSRTFAKDRYAPFLPLQEGDTGIRSVEAVKFNTANSAGTVNLILCKPVAIAPSINYGTNGPNEKEYINEFPSMPVIQDNAYLTWLWHSYLYSSGAGIFSGNLNFVWG